MTKKVSNVVGIVATIIVISAVLIGAIAVMDAVAKTAVISGSVAIITANFVSYWLAEKTKDSTYQKWYEKVFAVAVKTVICLIAVAVAILLSVAICTYIFGITWF